jgi:hypothetical protein
MLVCIVLAQKCQGCEFNMKIKVIAKLGKGEILSNFLIESKKPKNGKCLSMTLLDFYRSNQKISKRSPFLVLQ